MTSNNFKVGTILEYSAGHLEAQNQPADSDFFFEFGTETREPHLKPVHTENHQKTLGKQSFFAILN